MYLCNCNDITEREIRGAAAPYRPGTPASRATALSVIAALHVAAALAFVSARGIAIAVEKAPLLVQLLPQPPRVEPPVAASTLPVPRMQPPEVRLVPPPPIENLSPVALADRADPPPAVKMPVSVQAGLPAPPYVEPPRADLAYLNNPAPAYPSISRRVGERGRVLLRVRVDASGQVEAVEVQATSGFARLDDAALDAVRRWRFAPARLGDRAVAGVAIVPIRFELG